MTSSDRATRTFILLACLGIGLGFWGLISSKKMGESASATIRIARLSGVSKDTRIKRSGALQWFKASSGADCFENDRIFTGDASTVTVETDTGARLVLLPNTLISLSKGVISLESGSVEVQVVKAGIQLRAFGETIELTAPQKVRVTEDLRTAEIVSLAGPAVRTSSKNLPLPKRPQLVTQFPDRGHVVPAFPGERITFQWEFGNPGARTEYLLEISADTDFSRPVLSRISPVSKLAVSVSELPAGNLFWKVTETKSGAQAESSFFVEPGTLPEKLNPQDGLETSLQLNGPAIIQFRWNSKFSFPVILQVARDPDFSQLLLEKVFPDGQAEMEIPETGTYYWRPGYQRNGKTHWALASQFVVRPVPLPKPIIIANIPELDFALNPEATISWQDGNRCPLYAVKILQGNTIVHSASSKSARLKLPQLKDGEHRIEIEGTLEDGRKVSAQRKFLVKNSPPVPAPIIRNKKKVKLVVFLRLLFDSLIPSASADSDEVSRAFYTLKWEGPSESKYEIEIIRADKTLVEKVQTSEPSYKFFVPGPEKFFWRVRVQVGARWSAFSEFAEIEIADKVESLTEILMQTPLDKSTTTVDSTVKSFLLAWKSAGEKYTYLIEVFGSSKSKKPTFTAKVTGTSYLLRFKTVPKGFYWRVRAVSSYGKLSPPVKPYKLTINRRPEVPIRYQLQPSILYSTTDFHQDFAGNADIKDSASFAGPALNVSGEYFLKRYNHHRSLAFEARYGSFTSGSDQLVDTRLLLEYGWLSDPFGKETHNFHLGYLFHNIDFAFGDNLSAAYGLNFVSAKYSWIRIWSGRSLLEVTGSLLLSVPPKEYMPSFLIKPVYHQRLQKNWWLIFLAMYERYSASGTVKANDEQNDLSLSVQNISIGIGVSYRPE